MKTKEEASPEEELRRGQIRASWPLFVLGGANFIWAGRLIGASPTSLGWMEGYWAGITSGGVPLLLATTALVGWAMSGLTKIDRIAKEAIEDRRLLSKELEHRS